MTFTRQKADGKIHAPHPPLTDYYAREEDRRGWVSRVFDGSAMDYDRIERLIGFGSGSWYRGEALQRAGLRPGMRALDVGTGTGLVAKEAAKIAGDPGHITGIDPSPGMLRNARLPPDIRLVRGRVEQLPFPAAYFDFISMGYALRHIADLSVAFAECLRVLRPGGTFCILEITRPEKRLHAAMLKAYLRGVVPWLAKLSSRSADTPVLWTYYWDTIEACASADAVQQCLRGTGFGHVDRYLSLGMFSEYRAIKTA
jgi:demethylmenaquinone methyltransferase/2-methoxy-6-polyprenyl-1,4-benzoquinol methylase